MKVVESIEKRLIGCIPKLIDFEKRRQELIETTMTLKQKTIEVGDDDTDGIMCLHTSAVSTHNVISCAVTYIILYFMCIILLRDHIISG